MLVEVLLGATVLGNIDPWSVLEMRFSSGPLAQPKLSTNSEWS